MSITTRRENRTHCSSERRGAAAVEFALVLPVILILLVGSIEISGAIVVRHTLSEAARAGVRVYSLKTKYTEVDVHATIRKIMDDAKLTNYTVTLEPSPSTEVSQMTPVTVTVSIPSNSATWIHSPWFIKNKVISARCAMPADLGEGDSSNSSNTNSDKLPPGVFDTDSTGEGSGTSDKDLEKLQKEAQKLKEEAQKAQEKADKEAQKAAEEQAKADAEGTVKAQEKADKAAAKAAELAQEAADAWQAAKQAAYQVQIY